MATSKKSVTAVAVEEAKAAAPAAKPKAASKTAVKAAAKPVAVLVETPAPAAATKAPVKAVAKKAAVKTAAKTVTKAPAKKAAKPAAPKKVKPATVKSADIDPSQRAHYIEVAAYYIAERRGFTPGDPGQDYLAAAAEIDRLIEAGHFTK